MFSLNSLFILLVLSSINISGQGVAPICASITVSNLTYTQNFDTLTNTGTSSTVPVGFGFSETGTSARVNTEYSAGTGSDNTGDTYSYGASGSTERALGSIRTGTFASVSGACFINNTGGTINSIQISYDGEQWRLGATGREDKIDFQYSLDATSLTSGTWIDVNSLDFVAPLNSGMTGAKDGNAPDNRTAGIASTLQNLTVNDGATFYIRFVDFAATGSNDGLAIDNFSLTASSLTSALATISGRVTNAHGRGLNFITVLLMGGSLAEPVYARTNSFGYYYFSDVPVGENYVVSVMSKSYVFRQPSIFISLNENLTGVNFIGERRLER